MPIDPSALYARGLISDDAMQRLTPVSGDFPPGKTPPSKFLDYERRPPDLMGGAPRQSAAAKPAAREGAEPVMQNRGAQPEALGMASPIGKAAEVAAQLKDALGTEHFQTILSGLQDADKSHVIDVAKEFMGASYPSKIQAITKMQSRHNQLMQFRAKSRFMAGRSAG